MIEDQREHRNRKIEIGSIYGAKTKEGLVELKIDDDAILLTKDKAREIRGMLDTAIESAVSDELLMRFLVGRIGMDERVAVHALKDFRIMRQGSAGVVYPT